MTTAAIVIILHRPPNTPANAPYDAQTDTVVEHGSYGAPIGLKAAADVIAAEQG